MSNPSPPPSRLSKKPRTDAEAIEPSTSDTTITTTNPPPSSSSTTTTPSTTSTTVVTTPTQTIVRLATSAALKTEDKSAWPRAGPASEEDPALWLGKLSLASFEPLKNAKRGPCPSCEKNRRWFCYLCYQPTMPRELLPHVVLPVPVDVLQHPGETKGKSTAIHAKILASDQVTIYQYPTVPDYPKDEVVILYPSEEATMMSEVDLSSFKRVVFIDSTWSQSKRIARDPKVASLRRVMIPNHRTAFWRYQQHGPEFLATIEAIYYTLVEIAKSRDGTYNGSLDNLLYFYAHQYFHIQEEYKAAQAAGKQKTFSHIEGYIRPDPSSTAEPAPSESTEKPEG